MVKQFLNDAGDGECEVPSTIRGRAEYMRLACCVLLWIPIGSSTQSGGSSRPGSSPASLESSAMLAWPKSWRRTLVAALERWPESGVPDNPGAWLMTTAKHRAIDVYRRNKPSSASIAWSSAGRELETQQGMAVANFETSSDDDIGDDLLRLVFISCHPVLSREARVALTLRLLGGLTTEEIARAFLIPEPTVAQRIVRAKRTLTEARVPFEVPRGPDLAGRLSSVLEVIYLIFNEGYAATAGEDWMRPALCEDAPTARPNSSGACSERAGVCMRPRRA